MGPTGFGALGGLAYGEATGVLYGCVANSVGVGELVTCDIADGSCTTIGATGFDRCSALKFSPEGTLYGGIGRASIAAGELIQIDPNTGAGSAVSNTGFGSLSGLTFVPQRRGDFNGDLCVDRDDLGLLLNTIRAGSIDVAFEINSDGIVDREDSRVLVTIFDNRRGDPCL